jgi:hypothetical protein
LVNEYYLSLMEWARKGAKVVLYEGDSAHEVDSTNVDSKTAELEQRRATYAAAIHARGFAQVGGEYEIRSTECAKKTGPILVNLLQGDFEVFADSASVGQEGNDPRVGVVVESTLVFGAGAESSDYRHGATGGKTIKLKPFQEGVCPTLITRYQPPRVELANPEELAGTWEGMWDETYRVRFTISQSDGSYLVRYEHQEHAGGEMLTETYRAHASSKSSIRFGAMEINLKRKGDYGATAVGRFGPERKAGLRRISKHD